MIKPRQAPAKSPTRAALIADLNRAAREASGLGNLFGQAVAERLGLNPTDIECLGALGSGDVTAGDLARATGLTTGAITGVIDRLEKAGFVRRERTRDDRRKVYVRMTAAGRAAGEAHYGSLDRAVDRLAARYNPAEITLLTEYFDRSRAIMLREIEKLKKR